MEEETKSVKYRCNCHATGGGIYGLAFLGVLIYYLQNATTLMAGVWGILKALVWPAVMAYEFLTFLGAK